MLSQPGPLCDLVILTALRLEFQAVAAYLEKTQKVKHPSGTVYEYGTFQGEQRTWHVAVAEIGMGGLTAAVETGQALNFFQPELAFFVGVAGGIKDVRLGDVVVASKVYGYESGRAGLQFEPRPELWRADHALEQHARVEAREKRWLARLGSSPDPTPRVFVAPLAAGEKVVASQRSDVYRFLRSSFGDALAVEMEGHGFSHAVHVYHKVRGLVIRGISDLIEQKEEADVSGSQEMAAHHASAIAFEVLAHFALPSTFPPIWMVPFKRNLLFTGREDLLGTLHEQLRQNHSVSLSQPSAISGLGGIGKTQLAVEYAYRHAQQYRAVFWVSASSSETLISSYMAIAEQLYLPERSEQDQNLIVQAVKRWLQTNQSWLLILDNANESDELSSFLPTNADGHLLLTTRVSTLSPHLARQVELAVFTPDQGALLLLRRATYLAAQAPLEQAKPSDRELAMRISEELGGLPLALEQAGAYIAETACGLDSYLQTYHKQRAELLQYRGRSDLSNDYNYPDAVATTWSLSFEKVEQGDPVAADLLRLCAFLYPDAIPTNLVTQGASYLGSSLAPVAESNVALDKAVAALRAYSLIHRDVEEKTLSIHRLVQAVLQDTMDRRTRRTWTKRAVLGVNTILPDVSIAKWSPADHLLLHVLTCAAWIEQEQINSLQAANVLNWAGHYLYSRVRYAEAEPLLVRALTISEQQLGETHPGTAIILHLLAIVYNAQDKDAEAEPLLVRSLTISERLLGAKHPGTGIVLHHLALLFGIQGKFAEAKPLLERALLISERHPDTDHSFDFPATLYTDLSKCAEGEAELLYMHALTFSKLWTVGIGYTDRASRLKDLAFLYADQGQYAEAERLLERTVASSEQQKGEDLILILNDVALFYIREGKYGKAEPLLERVLAIAERLPRDEFRQALEEALSEGPRTADSLSSLAFVYKVQGKYRKAESSLKRALEISEQQLGAEHLDVADILTKLGDVYFRQRKYEKAESLWERALAITEHPDVVQSHINAKLFATMISILNLLAALYFRQRKYGKAESLWERALVITEQESGIGHPDVAEILESLALLSYQQGKNAEAEQLWQQALDMLEQSLGETHPQVADSLYHLAELYRE